MKYTTFDYIGFGWTVLLNIITVIVVLILFSKALTEFEQIILAILSMIFINFNLMSDQSSLSKVSSLLFFKKELKHIRKNILKEGMSSYEEEYENDEMQEVEKLIKKAYVKLIINGSFGSIVYVIALYKLLSAL